MLYFILLESLIRHLYNKVQLEISMHLWNEKHNKHVGSVPKNVPKSPATKCASTVAGAVTVYASITGTVWSKVDKAVPKISVNLLISLGLNIIMLLIIGCR